MVTRILQASELPQNSGEAPFAIAPVSSTLFGKRADRFRQLASGGDGSQAPHPQAEWLDFLAELCSAQQAAISGGIFSDCELPSPTAREQARTHLMPPLASASLERDPAWQAGLESIVLHLQRNLSRATLLTHSTLERLLKTPSIGLEALAGKVLVHDLSDDNERAASVFVAAALQAYWTSLAARIDAPALVRLDNKGLCPSCGSLPVGSVVRTDDTAENLRYLHCSLCNTQWNLVRVTCASCDDNSGIAYHSLHGQHPAVRAETCESCKGYLKILYLEKDPQADPVADDLATLALDLLIDEAGYERAGPNLFLLSGS